MKMTSLHPSVLVSSLQKYLHLFQISWAQGFVYRLNFVMWRLRLIIQFLVIYFLWSTILTSPSHNLPYTGAELLTYVLGTLLVRSLVLSSISQNIQNDIGSGDLNNFLLKPIGFYRYWFTRDLADKLLNLVFSLFELTFIIWLLGTPLLPPPSALHFLTFIISLILAAILYFFFNLIISFSVFWMPEENGWPQRFLVMVVLEFLSGGLFPLDLLPGQLKGVITSLPTAFFIHTPLQIYLGRLEPALILSSLLSASLWIVILFYLARFLYQRGLRVYGAYGS